MLICYVTVEHQRLSSIRIIFINYQTSELQDTWEGLKKLGNTMDLAEEFEKEIREEEIKRVQIRKEKEKEITLNLEVEMFKRSELPEKYTTKILFG